MPEKTLNKVNEHCLDSVMKLTESKQVTATEDIFDDSGNKLLAKGAAINDSMKDRLVCHKLSKPLETTLEVEDGVKIADITKQANGLIDKHPILQAFLLDEAKIILSALSNVKLEPAAALLMTAAESNRPGTVEHATLVALISLSLARHKKLSGPEAMQLATASLMHDLGELYIDPKYLNPSHIMKPDEWKHLISHPRVIEVALSELTNYPKPILDAVAQHHERENGSGYPRHLTAKDLSMVSRTLAVSETLSGILTSRGDVLTRACLALKCIPNEYDFDLVSIVSSLRKNYQGTPLEHDDSERVSERFQQTSDTIERLENALIELQTIRQLPHLPKIAEKLLNDTLQRVNELMQTIVSSGTKEIGLAPLSERLSDDEYEVAMEIGVIGMEVVWRMRNTARFLYLGLSGEAPQMISVFAKLINLLDNTQHIDAQPQ